MYHFPFRYFDKTTIGSVSSINNETEYIQLSGKITNISVEGEGRRKRLTATFFDQSGYMQLVWFQSIQYVQKQLSEYGDYLVFGKVNYFNGSYSITHPEFERFDNKTQWVGMQAIYSSTAKLATLGINNRSFGKLVQSLFQKIKPNEIPEILTPNILSKYNLIPRYQAFLQIHFPQNEQQVQEARYRLKWEELFILQMQIVNLKLSHTKQAGYYFAKVGDYFNSFFKKYLPFELTEAQKRVLREIRNDLATNQQMNRLLQGDVGSGKTMVAAMSILLALDNGFQACLMAPTEILARQHYQSIQELLTPLGISITLLTGSIKGKERKNILLNLKEGNIQLVIGTHAIIEDSVQFSNLGLAVIDEQHKFGVGQRARLWSKNTKAPHVLVMTATPIPRTLAMTLYGDLDISVIDELPKGRKPIKTFHRSEQMRAQVMGFLKSEIDKGRQVYVVYPLIDESEKLDYESLISGYEQLKSWFPDSKYKIAMVHGKQDPEERERNMERFVKGEAQILVATTVIEVGVNVPNASVMLIESSERFGLSQLHQLRGRVGRGADQSYCILLSGSKVSNESFERLKVMCESSDGFVIAEKDLEMRGPGDIYGTQQSGALKLKIADLLKDSIMLEQCRELAFKILNQDPHLEHFPNLKSLLIAKGGKEQWNKIS